MDIRVYRLLHQTKMAGPGQRFCLWVQGCSRHCKGCMAYETWPFEGGTLMDTEDILQSIASTTNIEGVTFLGGEPFEQAAAVGELAQEVKEIGLSVVVFTGYTYEELRKKEDGTIKKLLEQTDLLIDGPFVQEKFDLSRPWVGSSNQQYRFLTDRYHARDLENIRNQIEVRLSPDGKALLNGMGDFERVKKLL